MKSEGMALQFDFDIFSQCYRQIVKYDEKPKHVVLHSV